MATSRDYSVETNDKSYESAIRILNSRRRPARPEPSAVPREHASLSMLNLQGTPDLRGRPSIDGMSKWLEFIGHSTDDVNKLNVVHVAGTKGKGSTCAFAEAFLRVHGRRAGFPHRTGLYTSPHLQVPEERIRLNFEPISKERFAKYFFEVWDALQAKCPPEELPFAPRYLQIYALVAFHTFIKEGVDAAIIETHHGGEFDATNFITKPVVTAIATLGMDHVAQLGPSLDNIAWHKAGIMKSGAAAIVSPQEPRPTGILIDRARERNVVLEFTNPDAVGIHELLQTVSPQIQRTNCALAISSVNAFLSSRAPFDGNNRLTQEDIRNGIEQFSWPGRFQLLVHGPYHWFLESAHNELSMGQAAAWFASESHALQSDAVTRVLIFSQDSIQRDGAQVLVKLAEALRDNNAQLDHVVFTTYVPTAQTTRNDYCVKDIPEAQPTTPPAPPEQYPELWRQIDSTANLHVFPYIDQALAFVKTLSNSNAAGTATGDRVAIDNAVGASTLRVHALVTGSQHLVGGMLRLLDGPV